MTETIKTYEQVKKNILRYNEDLPKFTYLQDILSDHRDWYYIPTIRKYGPSKFIGYIDMTGQRYTNREHETVNLDGGITQKALSQFFMLENNFKNYDELEFLLSIYGKRPRSNVRFYIPKSL
jgi:hypothetical protein